MVDAHPKEEQGPLERYVALTAAFFQCACMGPYEMGCWLTLCWLIRTCVLVAPHVHSCAPELTPGFEFPTDNPCIFRFSPRPNTTSLPHEPCPTDRPARPARRANSFLRKLFLQGRHADRRGVLNEMKWSIMATYTETYKKLRKVRKS